MNAVVFENVKKHYPHFDLEINRLELPTGSIISFLAEIH
jgi:hypothetical protein